MIENIVPQVGSTVTKVIFNKSQTMAKLVFSDGKSIVMRIDSFIDNSPVSKSSHVSLPPQVESVQRVPVMKKPTGTNKLKQPEKVPSTMAEFHQLMQTSGSQLNLESVSNVKDRSESRSEALAKQLISKTGGNAETVLAGLPK